jgi:integrase
VTYALERMRYRAAPVLPDLFGAARVLPEERAFSRRNSNLAELLMKAKIEKFILAGMPDGKTQAVLWDSAVTGLGLRLRSGGSASWMLAYRPRGAGRTETARKLTLGVWPSVSLDAARAAARAKSGEIALGRDPAVERRVERTRERRIVSAALDEYENSIRRRRLVNVPTIMSTLRRGLAPLMAREIDALTRADLVALIDALESAGKPGAASDLRKHLRTWLEWCVAKGLVQFNVLAGLRLPRASRAERLEDERKGRALSDDEITSLWNACGSNAFGGLVRLGLLTGMRRGELAGLRWSDIRDDRIVLAAHDTKSGVRHEIPVTAAMRSVLTSQPRGTVELVFPSPRRKSEASFSGWTQLIAGAVERSGVDFRLHDLRRTARTLMSRLGVDESAAELAIGHTRGGLIGLYNRDLAWNARKDAFERVSAHIAQLVAGAAPDADEGADKRVVTLVARR